MSWLVVFWTVTYRGWEEGYLPFCFLFFRDTHTCVVFNPLGNGSTRIDFLYTKIGVEAFKVWL